MGRLFRTFLGGDRGAKVWVCACCDVHLAYQDDVVSKSFQGKHGRAFLIRNVVNVGVGKMEERELMTGLHEVADIHCNVCDTVLGWKYLHAHEEAQKYKEGMFLVEKAKITREKSWT